MRKKNLVIILSICILLFTLVITSTAFAYLTTSPIFAEIVKIKASNFEPEFKFKLNKSVRGIPGEILPISTINEIETNTPNDNIVFKITYLVNNDADFIKSISLDLNNTHLVKDPRSLGKQVSYFGVIKSNDGKKIDLGPLYAEFIAPSPESADFYNIKVEFIACQQTYEAIKDILRIEPVNEFAYLLD